jgi:hypothetical protein
VLHRHLILDETPRRQDKPEHLSGRGGIGRVVVLGGSVASTADRILQLLSIRCYLNPDAYSRSWAQD